jgi:segregation and condensation protein B
MELAQIKNIIEAVLLTADHPMDLRKLEAIFEADEENRPGRDQILQALQQLQEDYQGRGVELKEVSSGYRMQVVPACADWVSRMWEEKAPRYSRALLETLVLIAYRQPITRGEIEEIRGVSVSSHIVKTLSEREWVRVLGHKDVPGKPSMYGTTREFLDYFNLKSLDDLPSLAELKDLDKLHPELAFEQNEGADAANDAAGEQESTDTAEEQSMTGEAAETSGGASDSAVDSSGHEAEHEDVDAAAPADAADEDDQGTWQAEANDEEQPLNEQDRAEQASEHPLDDQNTEDQGQTEEIK